MKHSPLLPVYKKGCNLYSASSRMQTSDALFITNQNRPSHSHHVQAADTGWCSGQARQPQSAVQRSPPSVTHIMGYYSFNQPQRDGRLSWPCWLTDNGRFTHKVVKQPSISFGLHHSSLKLITISSHFYILCMNGIFFYNKLLLNVALLRLSRVLSSAWCLAFSPLCWFAP